MNSPAVSVSSHAWFNGELGPREQGAPSIASISLHLGTGVFDGLMAYWNGDRYCVFRAEEHFLRFKAGAARMELNFEYSVEQLIRAVHDLLAHEPHETYYIRPIAYRRAPELLLTGAEKRAVDVSIFAVKATHARDLDAPMVCQVSPVRRVSSLAIPGHTKVSGAYVNSVHARRTAEKQGYHDGIMLDNTGRLTEASAANLFLIKGNSLLTPRISEDVFPGITRKVVLELCAEAGIEVIEQDLYEQDLERIDGAFLCSTYMEVRGLSKLGEHPLDTLNLAPFRSVLAGFRKTTRA